MNLSDIIFCIADVAVEGLILYWAIRSRKVKVEAKSNSRLILSMMFLVVAVMSFNNYDGWLKWFQTISLVLIAFTFVFVKSGVSEDGIIVTGVEITWSQAGKVTLNNTENSVAFEKGNRPYRLYFKKEQMNDIREILNRKKKGNKKA